jgi:NAD(P)-dependent dehydrogenase (short-subunit alcohol dehydrogenase family)
LTEQVLSVNADLHGKVVWVTGGAKGLGRALALGFAREGTDIAFSYNQSTDEATKTQSEVQATGVRCMATRADLRHVGEVREVAREIDATLGRIDILINNAGLFERTPIDEMTEKQFDDMLGVNLKATLFASQEAARRMKRQGSGTIVNIASVGGMIPWRGYPVYCASKAAALMATRSLALALAPDVRVNAIAPGVLTVPKEMEPEDVNSLRENIPMGEFGRYDDVVEAALFLTKSGRYITGETLVVDGGRQLK